MDSTKEQGSAPTLRIERLPSGLIDEVVMQECTAHIEQLNGKTFAAIFTRPDGERVHVEFRSSTRLVCVLVERFDAPGGYVMKTLEWMHLNAHDDGRPVTAPALRVSEHIAVNQEFGWPDKYVVAHIPTGCALAWRIGSLDAALAVARAVEGLPLWGKSLVDANGGPTDVLLAEWPEALRAINNAIGALDTTCIVSDKGFYRILPFEYTEATS